MQLRDARLRKALDAAPDASLRPQERTREAIRAAAHGAVTPAWRRWWPAPGQRMPWTAALATVLLAGFITVLWQGEEVPGSRSHPQADVAAPATAPAPAASPAPAPAPAPAVTAAPSVGTAPAPAAGKGTQRAPVSPRRQAADSAAVEARREDPAPAAPPAPTPNVRDEAALARSGVAAPAAAPVLPPIVPPPPAAAAPQREAAASLRAVPPPSPSALWTQVRIEADGVAMVVPRAQASRLADLVRRALHAPADPAPAEGAAIAQLELGRGPDALGVLSLHGDRWRWSPVGDMRDARTLRLDAETSNALLQEAQRMLQR
jgi:hypothetical protein